MANRYGNVETLSNSAVPDWFENGALWLEWMLENRIACSLTGNSTKVMPLLPVPIPCTNAYIGVTLPYSVNL